MGAKQNRPRLGKGLSSLLQEPVRVEGKAGSTTPISDYAIGLQSGGSAPPNFLWIEVGDVVPNRFQPRQAIEPAALDRLAASIRQSGVMQPVAVRRRVDVAGAGPAWELIAGERRWRAACAAGLERIPAMIADIDDRDAAEWAVVENLQREDLNAIERGAAFKALIERFGLTQAEVADRVGLDRSTVANFIRLTELEPEVQSLIAAGTLTAGHGKAILSLPAGTERIRLAQRVVEERWPVRRLEQWALRWAEDVLRRSRGEAEPAPAARPNLIDLERQLGDHLRTRVRIKTTRDGTKGRLILEFYDLEHFDALMQAMGFRLRS